VTRLVQELTGLGLRAGEEEKIEVPTHMTKRGLYKLFCWQPGWKLVTDARGTYTRSPQPYNAEFLTGSLRKGWRDSIELHDWIVRGQQDKLVSSAKRLLAIVHSLFLATVCNSLLHKPCPLSPKATRALWVRQWLWLDAGSNPWSTCSLPGP
jgi:hypothetical protein